MDPIVKLYFERAENEIDLAESILTISDNNDMKKQFNIDASRTFYSGVITHSYYSMFYSVKAYLLSKNISIKSEQGQHQQIYFQFKKLVDKGVIDKELLEMYENVKVKAEYLLDILDKERKRRTEVTYQKLPQANKEPAKESLENAKTLIKYLRRVGEKK